jgi:pimeloyl-ACP methyl ester carboxylesterase
MSALLPAFPGSYVLISQAKAVESAAIFVHGFWGDAVKTWQHFHTLIDDPQFVQRFENSDLYFYDYPSTRKSVMVATDDLDRFLERIVQDGPFILALDGKTLKGVSAPRVAGKGTGRTYKSVLFVGHSMGGVVVRESVARVGKRLPATVLASQWPVTLRRSPRLFAPAHHGFLQADALAGVMGLHPAPGVLFAWWQVRRARAYPDLKPGSPLLVSLESKTKELIAAHPTIPAFKAVVQWGSGTTSCTTLTTTTISARRRPPLLITRQCASRPETTQHP